MDGNIVTDQTSGVDEKFFAFLSFYILL